MRTTRWTSPHKSVQSQQNRRHTLLYQNNPFPNPHVCLAFPSESVTTYGPGLSNAFQVSREYQIPRVNDILTPMKSDQGAQTHFQHDFHFQPKVRSRNPLEYLLHNHLPWHPLIRCLVREIDATTIPKVGCEETRTSPN